LPEKLHSEILVVRGEMETPFQIKFPRAMVVMAARISNKYLGIAMGMAFPEKQNRRGREGF
jgi:hypothetical protein